MLPLDNLTDVHCIDDYLVELEDDVFVLYLINKISKTHSNQE